VRFVEITFPLIVSVRGTATASSEFDEMLAGFERYFLRGERYALILYTAEGGDLPGARNRKRIAEWANQPRVRALSARLCVPRGARSPGEPFA
jgi:hypothetical protein